MVGLKVVCVWELLDASFSTPPVSVGRDLWATSDGFSVVASLTWVCRSE